MDPEILEGEVLESLGVGAEALGTEVMDREATSALPVIGKVPPEALSTLVAAKPPDAPLCGSVLVMIQFDVCEEIRLDQLRQILGARTADASFKHLAPGYVRYQRPPVEEALEPLVLESGSGCKARSSILITALLVWYLSCPFPATGTSWFNFPAAGFGTRTSKAWLHGL